MTVRFLVASNGRYNGLILQFLKHLHYLPTLIWDVKIMWVHILVTVISAFCKKLSTAWGRQEVCPSSI
ncbi:Phosphoribosylaminoimidazole-succinocarboxamide synthase [Bienertia sinuspersici]